MVSEIVSRERWLMLFPEITMIEYVRSQLPRAIAGKFEITVISDPYYLRTEAVFTDEAGRAYRTKLEYQLFDHREVACRIPESFIAHLCVVV